MKIQLPAFNLYFLVVILWLFLAAISNAKSANMAPSDCNAEAEQFETLLCQAKAGNADSMLRVALEYERRGTLEQAFFWYQKAADKGKPAAQYNLGVFYETGEIVKADIVTALSYYKKSAELGFTPAFFNLGNLYCNYLYDSNKPDCVYWLTKAGFAGDLDALYNLSHFLLNNGEDVDWAVTYLKISSEAGHQKSIETLKELQRLTE